MDPIQSQSRNQNKSRSKKKDRTIPVTCAMLVACAMFAYGFSNGSPLFQWMLPLAILVTAVAWALLWPSGDGSRSTRETA